MKIDLSNLRILCEIILAQAEEASSIKEPIDVDYYWSISANDMFNFNIENPTIIVGSLADDWVSLKDVLSGKNPVTPIDYERLGNIIKALGEIVSNTKESN
jgi:hypothetical protein